MKEFLTYIYNIRFDSASIGIQKNLLLAALIGVVSNLPKNIKNNFLLGAHIIVGTLLSTILTPFIMILIEHVFSTDLPVESGYGIASLVGIIGVSSIKKIIIDKLSSNKNEGHDS